MASQQRLNLEETQPIFHISTSTPIPVSELEGNPNDLLMEKCYRETIVFFIPGNPGIVQYYHSFLKELARMLSSSSSSSSFISTVAPSPHSHPALSKVSTPMGDKSHTDRERGKEGEGVDSKFEDHVQCLLQQQRYHHQIQIYSTGLAGFETTARDPNCTSPLPSTKLYGVDDQIDFIEERLNALIVSALSRSTANGTLPEKDIAMRSGSEREKSGDGVGALRVILIGHSLGAYVCMELIRRSREKKKKRSSYDDNDKGIDKEPDYILAGSILLFPTVMELAKSDSGVALTKILRWVPQLHVIAHIMIRLLTTLLPTMILRWLIKVVMRGPPVDAVETTTAFLKSPRGVMQALYMASDELRSITTDKWDDEVWGIVSEPHRVHLSTSPSSSQQPVSNNNSGKAVIAQPPKTIFYFGKSDHWVAEKTREDIIRLRGSIKGTTSTGNGNGDVISRKRPKMVICEEGLPHAFCLRHSTNMAKKTADFVREILLESE